ncbi:MAG: hypothetical protein ACTS8S_21155 [Giesbergeria sp.]
MTSPAWLALFGLLNLVFALIGNGAIAQLNGAVALLSLIAWLAVRSRS